MIRKQTTIALMLSIFFVHLSTLKVSWYDVTYRLYSSVLVSVSLHNNTYLCTRQC
jgi:hypothetical protein